MRTPPGLDKVGRVQPTPKNALSVSFSTERYIPQIAHLYRALAGRGVGHVQPCPTLEGLFGGQPQHPAGDHPFRSVEHVRSIHAAPIPDRVRQVAKQAKEKP